jgi:hypothetical protein
MECEAKPVQQHRWLAKLVGDWTYESDCEAGPDQPEQKLTGTERVTGLGDLWVVCNGQGEMPGGGVARMMMTLGYDPARQKFVGTWVGSMMTHLWVYEGVLDAAQKVLTLSASGPSFADPTKTGQYQDVIEFQGDDHRTLTSRARKDDGTWAPFMVVHYRRQRS